MHNGGVACGNACIARIVRHHEDGKSHVLMERAHQADHVAPQRRPQCGKGLVEQQHGPVANEAAGERHPLSLAAGHLGRQPALKALEPDAGERLRHAGAISLRKLQIRPDAESHIGSRRKMGKEVVVLEQHADRPIRRRPCRDIDAADPDHTALGPVETRNEGEERRLSRSARTDHGKHGAGFDGHVELHDHVLIAEYDALEGDRSAGHGEPPRMLRATRSPAKSRAKHRAPSTRAMPAASVTR